MALKHECPEKERIDKLYKVIFEGNGKPSLLVLIEGLTHEIQDLNKNQKRIVNTRRWVIGTGIAFIVMLVTVAGFFITILNNVS